MVNNFQEQELALSSDSLVHLGPAPTETLVPSLPQAYLRSATLQCSALPGCKGHPPPCPSLCLQSSGSQALPPPHVSILIFKYNAPSGHRARGVLISPGNGQPRLSGEHPAARKITFGRLSYYHVFSFLQLFKYVFSFPDTSSSTL